MKIRQLLTVLIAVIMLFSIVAFADEEMVTMYATDGTTVSVAPKDVEQYKTDGWYTEQVVQMYAPDGKTQYVIKSLVEEKKAEGWSENKEDVTITMYAPDGRTKQVYKANVQAEKAVGWFTEPVTLMYAADGRSKYVINSRVELEKSVGWYDNIEDVTVEMYAADGRTKMVFKGQVEANIKVGWYTSLDDVMVTMYAEDGSTKKFFKAYVEDMKKEGWYESEKDVLVTLYSIEGKTKTVYKAKVAPELEAGWYTEPVIYMYALDGRTRIVKQSLVEDYKRVGWYDNEDDIYQWIYSLSDKKYIMKNKVIDWVKVGWSTKVYPIMINVSFEKTSKYNSCIDLNVTICNTNSKYKSISAVSFDAYYFDKNGNAIKDIYDSEYTSVRYDCPPLGWYSEGKASTKYFANITGCARLKIRNIKVYYTDGTSETINGTLTVKSTT